MFHLSVVDRRQDFLDPPAQMGVLGRQFQRLAEMGGVLVGRLIAVLPDWSAPPIWLTLYYPPYASLPLRAATFSDFFETHVRETQPV